MLNPFVFWGICGAVLGGCAMVFVIVPWLVDWAKQIGELHAEIAGLRQEKSNLIAEIAQLRTDEERVLHGATADSEEQRGPAA